MWVLRCTIGEKVQTFGLIRFISVLKTMKRNNTPLSASIQLDDICRPINPSGKYEMPAITHPWLQGSFSIATIASALFHALLSLHKSFPGYNHLAKALFPLRSNVLVNSFNKTKSDNKQLIKYYS